MSYIRRNTIKKMFYWKSRLNVTNFIVYLPSTLKSCVASFYPLSNVLYRCIFLKEFPLNDEETKPQESQLTGSELHRQNREGWFRRQPTCYIRQKTKGRLFVSSVVPLTTNAQYPGQFQFQHLSVSLTSTNHPAGT